jgi:hypothetical protein
MMKDLHNNIQLSRGVSPAAATTDNTAYVSQIIDTNGFGSCEFVGQFGSIADADVTFTVLVEDGNVSNLSDNSAVDDQFLLGIEAMVDGNGTALRFDQDDKTIKIGYCGPKRYVRVTITPANNTGNVFFAGLWLQGHPRVAPKTTQIR